MEMLLISLRLKFDQRTAIFHWSQGRIPYTLTPYLDDIVPLSYKQDDAMKDNPLHIVRGLWTELF